MTDRARRLAAWAGIIGPLWLAATIVLLSIAQYDNQRPIWMPSFPSLSTSLGMTWKQMLAAVGND